MNYAAMGVNLVAGHSRIKPHKFPDLEEFFYELADNLAGEDYATEAREAYDGLPKHWRTTRTARLTGELTRRDKVITRAEVTGEELSLADIAYAHTG